MEKGSLVITVLLLCSLPLNSFAKKQNVPHPRLEKNAPYPMIQKLGIIVAKNVFHAAAFDGYIVNFRNKVYGDIQNKAIHQEAAIRGQADELAREAEMRRKEGDYNVSPSAVRDRYLRNNLGKISSDYTAEDVRLVMQLYTLQIRTMGKLLYKPRYHNHNEAISSLMPGITLDSFNEQLVQAFGFTPAAPLKKLYLTEEENRFVSVYGQELLARAKSIEKEWFGGAWGTYHAIKALTANNSELHKSAEKALVRLRPEQRRQRIKSHWGWVEKDRKNENYSMAITHLNHLKKLTPEDERIAPLMAKFEAKKREKDNEQLADGPPLFVSGDYLDRRGNSYTIVQNGDSTNFTLYAEGDVPAEVAEGVLFGRKVTLTWKGSDPELKEILWIKGTYPNRKVAMLSRDDGDRLLLIKHREEISRFKRPKSLGSRPLGSRAVEVEYYLNEHFDKHPKHDTSVLIHKAGLERYNEFIQIMKTVFRAEKYTDDINCKDLQIEKKMRASRDPFIPLFNHNGKIQNPWSIQARDTIRTLNQIEKRTGFRVIGIRFIDYKRRWYAVYLRVVDSDEVFIGQFMFHNSMSSHLGRALTVELPNILSRLFKTDQSKKYIAKFGRKPGDEAQQPEEPVTDRNGTDAAPESSRDMSYLGCFRDDKPRDLKGHKFISKEMTGAKCIHTCRDKGFSYAGTQYRKFCFCGNSYGAYGKTDKCTTPCSGDRSEKCGGNWANSVYKTGVNQYSSEKGSVSGSLTSKPSMGKSDALQKDYLGCFRDHKPRDLKGPRFKSKEMTGAKCINTCKKKGFSYAGTQYRKFCFCGNSYGAYGKTDKCTAPCSGDQSEKCGGSWANSVYRINLSDH